MRHNFGFSNLLGSVYKDGGNVLFTPDGNCLISPVGNRVSVFDLINNTSFTFPFQNRENIKLMALSPDGMLLLTVDVAGYALLSHYHRKTVYHRMRFKSPITALSFSPCGRFISVALQQKGLLQVWCTPLHGLSSAVGSHDGNVERDFSPFVLHRTYSGHYDSIYSIQWSPDSQLMLTCSKDMTIKVFTREPVEGYSPITMAAHRDSVIGAWFSKDGSEVYSVGKDGSCFVWSVSPLSEEGKFSPEESKIQLKEKHYFNQKTEHGPARVKSAELHVQSGLLVVGFSSGVFGLYEMPAFNCIHSLSISQKKIDSVAISPSGEWLAFASAKLGQLLVWEWQSESYILKQQGHYYDLNCVAYSPDGRYLASGGDDGKVKIWNSFSGFCFVTFTEHSAAISALEFASKQGGQQGVVFSASLDGTVRAFDLIRYRNFRTFTSPHPVQFSCLAVDPSGEIVCAGSMDTFEIFVWSVQTGRLLDILAGHEGPVSSLAFSQQVHSTGSSESASTILVSSSWDHSVKVWDLFSRGSTGHLMDTFRHKADVLAVAIRPDGKEICAATLDGQLVFWDPINGGHLTGRSSEIQGRSDLAGGRRLGDSRTAMNNAADKYFTSICYTADGSCVLAGGQSKWVCLYDIVTGVLLKRFQLSANLSMDGARDKLNSRNLTEAGPLELLQREDEEPSDLEERLEIGNALPGSQQGNRLTKPLEIRCKCIRFNPSGTSWASATTEGLLIYSLDDSLVFDPFDLDLEVTPANVLKLLKTKSDWLGALIMALRLNEPRLVQLAYESLPADQIPLLLQDLPRVYLNQLLRLLSVCLDISAISTAATTANSTSTYHGSPNLEFHLQFLCKLLYQHGSFIQHHSYQPIASDNTLAQRAQSHQSFAVGLRSVKKHLQMLRDELGRVADDNLYTLKYIINQANSAGRSETGLKRPVEDSDGDDEGADEVGDEEEMQVDDLFLMGR